jgi:hypothetical protein
MQKLALILKIRGDDMVNSYDCTEGKVVAFKDRPFCPIFYPDEVSTCPITLSTTASTSALGTFQIKPTELYLYARGQGMETGTFQYNHSSLYCRVN